MQSGAKGSTVNTIQISALLGQIELEGKRPPLMISRKSLPSFPIFEVSPRSGGFIDGRFLSGIRPQEFFFHCMAGREGLIDTAVKTSRSGYLQRCLIKHLESLTVNYDLTVRDADKSVIQFFYGEDGMDVTKSQFLKLKHLKFLKENYHTVIEGDLMEKLSNDPSVDFDIQKYKKQIRRWIKKFGTPLKKRYASPFLEYSKSNSETNNEAKESTKNGRSVNAQHLIDTWNEAGENFRENYENKDLRCPDPIISTMRPDNNFGSISEYLETLIESFAKLDKQSKRTFTEMVYVKSTTSLADPGEPVGLLAAQSVGEPSTQMTLNTFHFAGRGEMNVTLGIPRLREVLMLASKNIKTPSMDIPFLPSTDMGKIAEKLRIKLNRVCLNDLLQG